MLKAPRVYDYDNDYYDYYYYCCNYEYYEAVSTTKTSDEAM